MGEGLDYEATLRLLRALLVEAAAGAWAFGLRAGRSPSLLSERGWSELADIEGGLRVRLERGIRDDLRADVWIYTQRLRTAAQAIRLALGSERSLVVRLREAATEAPLEVWRQGAPQLEAELWPFVVARTRHLANALSLALNEPAPFPPLIWHPGQREFR